MANKIRIPSFIKKLTLEEAFIYGFEWGYQQKEFEINEEIKKPIPTFKFLDDKDKVVEKGRKK